MTIKQLFSIPEAAAQLGMGITKTRELIRTGQIKSVHIGRSIRVTSQAVADFIRQLEDQS